MKRKARRIDRGCATLTRVLGVLSFMVGACRGTPPPPPLAGEVQWKAYSNAVVGYSLEVPDVYDPRAAHAGKDVLFRYQGYPVLVVNYIDEAEGKSRGLWPGHERAGEIELAGRSGNKYVYDHYDGPSSMRTVSYVVEHRGKFLGLEFRTTLDAPDAIQERIVESLRFQ